MNNFQKKTALQSLSSQYELPYQSLQEVGLVDGQLVNTSIANSFQKLLENDLFIERSLSNEAGFPKGPGKQVSLEISSLSNLAGGEKFWNVSDDKIGIMKRSPDDPDGYGYGFIQGDVLLSGKQITFIHNDIINYIEYTDAFSKAGKSVTNLPVDLAYIGTTEGLYTFSITSNWQVIEHISSIPYANTNNLSDVYCKCVAAKDSNVVVLDNANQIWKLPNSNQYLDQQILNFSKLDLSKTALSDKTINSISLSSNNTSLGNNINYFQSKNCLICTTSGLYSIDYILDKTNVNANDVSCILPDVNAKKAIQCNINSSQRNTLVLADDDKLYIDLSGNFQKIDTNGLKIYDFIYSTRTDSLYKIANSQKFIILTNIGLISYVPSDGLSLNIQNKTLDLVDRAQKIFEAPDIEFNETRKTYTKLSSSKMSYVVEELQSEYVYKVLSVDFDYKNTKYLVEYPEGENRIADVAAFGNRKSDWDTRKIMIGGNDGISAINESGKTFIKGSGFVFDITAYNSSPLCTETDVHAEISSLYKKMLEDHIAVDHAASSDITKINTQLMSRDCAEYLQLSSNLSIADIVDTVEFNSDIEYVSAIVKHNDSLASYDGSISGVSWICKRNLKSYAGEMYVYVPTTNTYYINNIDEVPGNDTIQSALTRKNVNAELSRKISDNCTYLSVVLDNSKFKIADVQNIEINGNSLPLKMYIDDASNGSNQRFSSIVKPSMVRSLGYVEDNGKIILPFIVFGSDAQAIRFRTKNFLSYTVKFDRHGADSGSMDNVEMLFGRETNLPDCTYIKNGYVLDGWSTNISSTVGEIPNMSRFSPTNVVDGQVVTLYAIWKEFNFGDGATSLKLTTDTQPIHIAYGDKSNAGGYVIIDYDYQNQQS